jgi:hypothetical protein
MIRIPAEAFQTAIGNLLAGYQNIPVYDFVPRGAKLPYIVMDEMTMRPGGSKDWNLYDATQQIAVYSSHNGKKEINNIINDIATLLTGAFIDMTADKFNITKQWIDICDMMPGTKDGYVGIITFRAMIEEMGE